MAATNTLVCFTNCKLALEDGSIVSRDLWIDEEKGVILDSQVSWNVLWDRKYFWGAESESRQQAIG